MNISIHLNKAHFLAQKYFHLLSFEKHPFFWNGTREYTEQYEFPLLISMQMKVTWNISIIWISYTIFTFDIFHLHLTRFAVGCFKFFFFFFSSTFVNILSLFIFWLGICTGLRSTAFHTVGIQFVLSDVQFASMFRFFFGVCTNSLEIWK